MGEGAVLTSLIDGKEEDYGIQVHLRGHREEILLFHSARGDILHHDIGDFS